jgi:hypothetical protein
VWLEKEFGLVIGFTELVTTSNCDSLTELHTPKIIVATAHTRSSQSSLAVACSGFQRWTFLILCFPELSTASGTSFSPLTTVTTDGQSASLSWYQAPSEAQDQIFITDSCGFVAGHVLWRQDRSVVYNCCWPSPAQSLSSPGPAGLMIIFYCLRFQTPPTWRARSP